MNWGEGLGKSAPHPLETHPEPSPQLSLAPSQDSEVAVNYIHFHDLMVVLATPSYDWLASGSSGPTWPGFRESLAKPPQVLSCVAR